jgi:hypothetical protein
MRLSNARTFEHWVSDFRIRFLLRPFLSKARPDPVRDASVRLQKPSKQDSGDYKCSVKNKWGNDHTTFNLN